MTANVHPHVYGGSVSISKVVRDNRQIALDLTVTEGKKGSITLFLSEQNLKDIGFTIEHALRELEADVNFRRIETLLQPDE